MSQYFYKISLFLLCIWVGLAFDLHPEGTELIFCDVGQGDAILINSVSDSYQILVDTGPDEKVLSCLEENLPLWDKQIELVVLTHPDLDHIGGFLSLTQYYHIGTVLYVPRPPDTVISASVLEEIGRLKLSGTRLIVPSHGAVFIAPNEIKLEVINLLFPLRLEEECFKAITETQLWDKNYCFLPSNTWDMTSKNSLSIGIMARIEGVSIFLAADMEEKDELALLKAQALHRVDVLKVGHHGAKTGTTKEILEVLQPEISVLSVGKNNKYNHPSPRVLQQLEEIGSQVFRTDTQGTVKFLLKEGVFLSK